MANFDNQKLISFLQSKWKGRSCPMCNVGPWTVSSVTFQLAAFDQGSVVISGPVMPVIPVNCENCGNTVLINAIVAGVIQRPKKAETAKEPDTGEVAQPVTEGKP